LGVTGNDILIGDSGYVARTGSDDPESVRTTDPDKGGADTLIDLIGANVLIGGFANDTIQA
jgi:hypothetical protein